MNNFLQSVGYGTIERVPVCSAIDVFQGLAGAVSHAALFDAMLGLALDYARGPQACVIINGQVAARAGSAAMQAAGEPDAALACALELARRHPPTPGLPTLAEQRGRTAVALAVAGAGGRQHAILWVLHDDAPSADCLQTLNLIAACGGAMYETLPASNLAWPDPAVQRGLLRTLIDNMPDQIYVKDRDGRFVIGNQAAADCIGVATPEGLVGKSDLEFFPDACGQKFFLDEQAVMSSGQALVDQLEENINAAGVRRWFSTTKVPFKDEQGRVVGIVGMSRDVSLRVAADEAIRLRNRAIESSLDAIVITDCLRPGNPVVYVNPAFERITGFCAEDARVTGISHLLDSAGEGDDADNIVLAMRHQCDGRAVIQSRRKDTSLFWNEVRVAPVRDLAGKATHFVYTMTDITKARDTEEQLERLASHDVLTGLPNRRMLMDRLGQAIAMGERGNFVVAIAFIDLDGLKTVNDELGHEAGDVLLQTVATRMAACVRKSDTVARLGGDEFVLITLHNTLFESASAPGLGHNYAYVNEMLLKLQQVLAEPLELGGQSQRVTCSVGVSIYPQHGADPETLLKNADAAMYSAKKTGRNRIKFYANDPERP